MTAETNRDAAVRMIDADPPTRDVAGRLLTDRAFGVVVFARLGRALVYAVLDIGDAIRETRGGDR